MLALVQIRFGAHGGNEPNAFDAAMCAQPQVLSCQKITGDADHLMRVVAAIAGRLQRFYRDVLRQMPGVASTHSSMALREGKAGSRLLV